jgi:nucleoid-associated protein YgaU
MSEPIALLASAKKGSGGAASNGAAASPAQLAKAQLTLYDPSPAPSGGGAPGAQRGTVPFQFNPKEVTITKSVKWERKPTKGSKKAGPPEFIGPEPSKMTLEMFFDATSKRDDSVVKAVESLLACCVATQKSAGQKKATPPLVVLHWGTISSFPAVVTSVSAKFTLFNSDGTPIRATCSVSLEEMPGEKFRQNPTSGSHEVRRVHRTIAGDTLASVAYAEYGDPNAWRPLAAFNEIDDPLRVRTGTMLLLPSPEELAVAQ